MEILCWFDTWKIAKRLESILLIRVKIGTPFWKIIPGPLFFLRRLCKLLVIVHPNLRLSNERQRQAWLENEVKVLHQRVQKTDEVLAAANSLGEQIAAKNQVSMYSYLNIYLKMGNFFYHLIMLLVSYSDLLVSN